MSWPSTTFGDPMPDILFSRQDIISNLREVAEILADAAHPQVRLILVGGSYLALQGLRDGPAPRSGVPDEAFSRQSP